MSSPEHRLVFVGGLEGSGTSLVARLIAAHPLASALRGTGFSEEEGQNVQDVFDTARSHGGAGSWAFAPEMHMDETSPRCRSETARQLLASWEPYFDLSKPLLVEKSPPNMLKSRFLQGLFPSSSFVMVVRHPVVVVEATAGRSGTSRGSLLEYWLRAHEQMADDLLHLERVLVVHYEDLVENLQGEYQRMIRFVGLSPVPATAGLRASSNESYYRSWERGAPWRRFEARRVARECAGSVERFGYLLARPYVASAARAGGEEAPANAPKPLGATEVVFRDLPGFSWSTVPDGVVVSTFPDLRGGLATLDPLTEAEEHLEDRLLASEGDRRGEGPELRVAARRGAAFTGGMIGAAVLQFFFFVLVTHTLNQGKVGALLEAIAIFTILSNVTELGADTGLLRYMPVFLRRRPQDLARVARVALVPSSIASMAAAVALYFFAPELAHLFGHNSRNVGTTTDLRILGVMLPASTITTVACAGVRAWTARTSVLINSVVIPLARPVLFGAFFAVGITAQLATLAWAAPIGAGVVIAVYALISRIRNEPLFRKASTAGRERRPIAREFWTFSVPRTFGAIFQILITYLDVLFVGVFLSAKHAAVYSIASRYIVYGTFALQAVSVAVAPQLSRLVDARDRDGLNAVYRSSTWWAMAASWPVLLVLAVFAPLFMPIFGHGYRIGDTTLTVLALAMLANTGTGSCGVLLLMSGRSKLMLGLQAVGLGVNIGLNVWLVPSHGALGGLVGAAVAWTATILILAVGPTLAIWRSYGVLPFGKGYVVVAAASVGCFGGLGVVTRAAFGSAVIPFVCFAVVSSSIYVALLLTQRTTLKLEAFGSVFGRFVGKSKLSRAPATSPRA
jgi:O-antigen/teichoic acid export membrane protein